MASKKYEAIVHSEGYLYTGQVVRRRTSRGTTVENQRVGFVTHAEAQAWADTALVTYLERRAQRKAADKLGRQRTRERDAQLDASSFARLAILTQQGPSRMAAAATANLKYRADLLWQEIVFRAFKDGLPESDGIAAANKYVGANWTQRFINAQNGELDRLW